MSKTPGSDASARTRLLISATIGLIAAVVLVATGRAGYAPLVAWDVAALSFVVAALATVLRFDANETRRHALRENPGRGLADLLLIITSIASIAAVGVLIFQANDSEGIKKGIDIALGLVSVVVSWSVVHTVYLLNYARLYYAEPEGGIDFNESEKPCYMDFAYLAFTVGMTFQISDTDLQDKKIRSTVLKHAVLSYLFGTVIIATTINTVVTLSSN